MDDEIRLYFEAANDGKYIVWCDNWCALVDVEDIEFALNHAYFKRIFQLIDEVTVKP